MRVTIGRASIVLGLLAAAALIVWTVMPGQIPVETAAVTKGRFTASVDEDGKTRVRERYVVAAPLAGRLTRVALKVGDKVATDEVVATITPPPAPLLDPRSRREAEERLGTAEAARERSKATVERAQAQAAQAKTDLDRAEHSPRRVPQLCRRWNAPNYYSGLPIAICALRNSRITPRATRWIRRKHYLTVIRIGRTRRSNAGTSRHRCLVWC